MTIEEVVKREREEHERFQRMVDDEIYYEEYEEPTLEEFFNGNQKSIEMFLNACRLSSEYHRQIAEWLEELLVLRSKV